MAATALTRPPSTSPSSGRRRSISRPQIGYIDDPKEPLEKRQELLTLRGLGLELVPITLPDGYPLDAITLMLDTEAAAVFDELTRHHVTEGLNRWPDIFRAGQFVPAVAYLRLHECGRCSCNRWPGSWKPSTFTSARVTTW